MSDFLEKKLPGAFQGHPKFKPLKIPLAALQLAQPWNREMPRETSKPTHDMDI